MAKTLCEWSRRDLEKHPEKLLALVTEPLFYCRRCARVANVAKVLCKPRRLPRHRANTEGAQPGSSIMPYLFFTDGHSLLRWVVFLAGFWALIRVWSGFAARSPWTRKEHLAGLVFTSLLNLQVLLGILLYAISPITRSALANFAGAMKDPVTRFFAVEHPTAMLAAAIIAQAGFSLAKRASSDRASFRRAVIAYSVAALLVVAAIPWPFLKYGRPLLPFGGG